MTVFKKTLPITITSFVNKCGDIGMYLFPMLLVEQSLTPYQSSAVLFCTKTALLLGTFLGGTIAVRINHRNTLIISLLLSAIGLSLLPVASGLFPIAILGILTRLGHGMFQAPVRLLTAHVVRKKEQVEAFAWLRTTNNLALIFGNTLSFFGASLGLLPFFIFDGLTSFFSALIAFRKIPNIKINLNSVTDPFRDEDSEDLKDSNWAYFLIVTFSVAGFSFLFDCFMVMAAASCKIHFQENGQAFFSAANIINTILCTLSSVYISRRIVSPVFIFPMGLFSTGIANVLMLKFPGSVHSLLISVFFLTLGEIFFTSLAQVELLRALPSTRLRGDLYHGSLVLQALGRILGSALAFPLLNLPQKTGITLLIGLTFGWVLLSTLMSKFAPKSRQNVAEIPIKKSKLHHHSSLK